MSSLPSTTGTQLDDDSDEPEATSTIEATFAQPANPVLETQPAEKLRLLMEISSSLGESTSSEKLLPKIVDSLLSLFGQSDRCILILADKENTELTPRLVKTRTPCDESDPYYDKRLIRMSLKSARSILSDVRRDERLSETQDVALFRTRSVMTAPLVSVEGKAFGVIQLETQDRSKKFTLEDLQLLSCVAVQSAAAIEKADLRKSNIP